MVDLNELKGFRSGAEEIKAAKRGDMRPLVELLRSDQPLSRKVRKYLADELGRNARQRFQVRDRKRLEVRDCDKELLSAVWYAKVMLACEQRHEECPNETDEQCMEHAYDNWQDIEDKRAFDYLTVKERFPDDLTIDKDKVRNARDRSPASFFNPKKP